MNNKKITVYQVVTGIIQELNLEGFFLFMNV